MFTGKFINNVWVCPKKWLWRFRWVHILPSWSRSKTSRIFHESVWARIQNKQFFCQTNKCINVVQIHSGLLIIDRESNVCFMRIAFWKQERPSVVPILVVLDMRSVLLKFDTFRFIVVRHIASLLLHKRPPVIVGVQTFSSLSSSLDQCFPKHGLWPQVGCLNIFFRAACFSQIPIRLRANFSFYHI